MSDYNMTQRNDAAKRSSSRLNNRVPYIVDVMLLCAVVLGSVALCGLRTVQVAPAASPVISPVPVATIITSASPVWIFGNWTLGQSVDQAGNDWSESRLVIASQRGTEKSQQLTGYFEWKVSGQIVGTEQVTGSYDPDTRELELIGSEIDQTNENLPIHLVPGDYKATLSSDGTTLIDGTWTGAEGISAIPGTWSASIANTK